MVFDGGSRTVASRADPGRGDESYNLLPVPRVGGEQGEHARIIDAVAGEPGANHVR